MYNSLSLVLNNHVADALHVQTYHINIADEFFIDISW